MGKYIGQDLTLGLYHKQVIVPVEQVYEYELNYRVPSAAAIQVVCERAVLEPEIDYTTKTVNGKSILKIDTGISLVDSNLDNRVSFYVVFLGQKITVPASGIESERISLLENNIITKDYVDNKVAALVDSAPETLNTLSELATALGDNSNVSNAIIEQLSTIESNVSVLQTTTNTNESDINTLKSRVTVTENDIGTLQSDLAAEISRATFAETTLTNNLIVEESYRQDGDTILQNNINDEQAARIDGDAATLASANNYTDAEIAALKNSAPELLNTLSELANALDNDENFATGVTNRFLQLTADIFAEASARSIADQDLDARVFNLENFPNQIKNISELDDVLITAAQPLQVLRYNGSQWENQYLTLSTVATSGDYNDLSNKPSIPSRLDDLIDMSVGAPGDKTTLVFHPEGGPYGAWWAEKISYNDLTNKPILSAVAATGSFNDLSNTQYIVQSDSSGNVCIGAEFSRALTTKLDVRGRIATGSGNADAEIAFTRPAHANKTAWNMAVRTDVGGSNEDFKLMRFIGGAYQDIPFQVQSTTGYIGIGTAAPTSALSVSGPISTTNSTAGVHLGTTGNWSGIELTNSNGGYIDFTNTATDSLARIIFVTDGGANNLQIHCTAAINFHTGGGERGGIDTNGFWYLGQSGNRTNPVGANVYIDSASGAIFKATSSLKYKKDVRNYSKGLAEVLALRPVSFKSKDSSPYGDDFEFAGLIAEEVHAAGMTEFVQYAADSTPDGLSYGHMVALAFKAIQELNTKVDQLTEENRQLKERLTSGGL